VISDAVAITVTPAEVVEIFCRPANVELTVGDTANFLVQTLMTDLTIPAVTNVTYASSAPAVAAFNAQDPNGVITAVSLGESTVTATWETLTDVCEVEVVEELNDYMSCAEAKEIDAVDQTISGRVEGYDYPDYPTAREYAPSGGKYYTFEVEDVSTLDLRTLIPGEDYWDDETDWDMAIYVFRGDDCYDWFDYIPYDDENPVVCLEPSVYTIMIGSDGSNTEGSFEIDLDFEPTDTCWTGNVGLSFLSELSYL
jgi:hypothetical protein